MADISEPILKTIQEAKMAKKILQMIESRRKRYGPDCEWLYRSDVIRELKEFSPNSVRSFIDKVVGLKVMMILPFEDDSVEWGGNIKFTSLGEQRIRKELKDISGSLTGEFQSGQRENQPPFLR